MAKNYDDDVGRGVGGKGFGVGKKRKEGIDEYLKDASGGGKKKDNGNGNGDDKSGLNRIHKTGKRRRMV